MGDVYEALDTELGVHVAVKTVIPVLADDPLTVERFRREVLLARRVTHPNVCRIFELNASEDHQGQALKFLTMEFLDGESLAQRLKRGGPLSPTELLPILRQLAAALDAAHAQGVVHRDLKPSNVMLASGDRVVVTDFGIARAIAAPEGEGTQAGIILGTPSYMAPEQIAGGPVSTATDVYSLGLLLREALTGISPQDWVKVSENSVPTSSPASRMPRSWAAVISRCLEFQPGRRYAQTADAVGDLEGRHTIRQPALAAGGIVALCAAVAVFVGVRHLRARPVAQSTPIVLSRPALAVLGFRNAGLRPDQSWVAPTLGALLTEELSGTTRSLRVVSSGDISDARRSLGLGDSDVSGHEELRRLRALLGVKYLVTGKIEPMGEGQIRLSWLLDSNPEGHTEESTVAFDPDQLLTTIPTVGGAVRRLLGVAPSAEEEDQLVAARPRTLAAARFYAQGLTRLVGFDYPGARESFSAASTADERYHASQLAEARTLMEIATLSRARAAAQKAYESAAPLSDLAQRRAKALLMEASHDDVSRRQAAREAFNLYPDDPEFAVEAVHQAEGVQAASLILERWKKAGGQSSFDFLMESADVADKAGDAQGATKLLDVAEARANDLQARDERAWVLIARTDVGSHSFEERYRNLVTAREEFSKSGSVIRAAETWEREAFMHLHGPDRSKAQVALTNAISSFRSLGLQRHVLGALLPAVWAALHEDDVPAMERRFAEYLAQLKALEEPEGPQAFRARMFIASTKGDLATMRSAAQDLRRAAPEDADQNYWATTIENAVFTQEDRLPEARAVLDQGIARAEAGKKGSGEGLQSARCVTFCFEDRARDGMECLNKIPGKHPHEDVECALVAKDATSAARTIASMYERHADSPIHLASHDLFRARLRLLEGTPAAALTIVRPIVSEANARGWGQVALEAQLVAAHAEFQVSPATGRPRLAAFEKIAREKGFTRLARIAHDLSAAKRP